MAVAAAAVAVIWHRLRQSGTRTSARAGEVPARIIDSHLHVWNSSHAYSQPPPPALGDAVASAPALLGQLARAGVAGALVVQPINYGFDHSHVTAVLAAQGGAAPVLRGMCLVDPTLSPVEAVGFLRARHAEGYVAVRFNPYLWPAAQHRAGAWLADSTGRALFAEAGKLGMPVGVMAFKGLVPLLPSLQGLMRESPATVVIIDHCGFVREKPAEPPSAALAIDEEAFQQLLSLAAYPQVLMNTI